MHILAAIIYVTKYRQSCCVPRLVNNQNKSSRCNAAQFSQVL